MNRAAWMLMTPAALAVLAAAVWLFGGWQDPERWPIRWLEVEGNLERTTSAQVRAPVPRSRTCPGSPPRRSAGSGRMR